jgi:hypothetical protein
MELETLTPEEVTEKETLLVSFLLEHDMLFQKFANGFFVRIPTVKVPPQPEDSPTA